MADRGAARGPSGRPMDAVKCRDGELGVPTTAEPATEDVVNPNDLEIGGQLRKRLDVAAQAFVWRCKTQPHTAAANRSGLYQSEMLPSEFTMLERSN